MSMVEGVNGHSEIALYVDTFDEIDAAFKNAIENGATPVLEPELEPWGQRTCYSFFFFDGLSDFMIFLRSGSE